MKQIRKMSNLVAEELQSALEAKGIKIDENTFEERVSDIVTAIDEAVNEEQITEDDKFYMATKAGKLGGKDIAEGEYVEIEDTDEGSIATIYDEDGNIKESDIPVDDDEVEVFTSGAEELEDDEEDDEVEEGCKDCNEEDDEDEEEVEESSDEEDGEEVEESKVHIKGGKKVKMTKSELLKKKAIKQGKKREGMKWDGKRFVKMSAKERKQAKMWAKKMHKGSAAAKAKKSQKKARKIAAGSTSGTVTESFDIHSEHVTFTAEAGDIITLEDGMISVVREGKVIISGIEVSEGFFDRCFEAEVIDKEVVDEEVKECGKKCNEEDDESDEADDEEANESAILTFKANQGYVLVKEGSELPMGNRVRARATLVSEGYSVTSAQLDAASKGEMVTL